MQPHPGGGLLDDPPNVSPSRRLGRSPVSATAVVPGKQLFLMSPLFRYVKHALAGKSGSRPPGGVGSGNDHYGGSGGNEPWSRSPRPTAYLDGLRGFAAFIVYFHHHQLWVHAIDSGDGTAILESGFGWRGQWHLATLPVLRTAFTGGHFAVGLFYVISGYVLSVKTLDLIHDGQLLRAVDAIGSALFRRWFRLYISLAVTTFVFVSSWHLTGMYHHAQPPKDTYAAEVWNWYVELKNFSFLFKEGAPWLSYNMHLWTIPLEMRGSVVTYVTLLTVLRAPTARRLLVQCALIIYFLYVCDGWYAAVFVTGMLQCDLDLLARRPDAVAAASFPAVVGRRLEPYKTTVFTVLFVLALLLSGVPSHTTNLADLRSMPGWYWLSFLVPQAVFDYKWFFIACAANLMVAAAARLVWLRRFLEAPFCQWLSRVSFALYLVHGPLMVTVGDRVYHAVGWVRPRMPGEPDLTAWSNLLPLPRNAPLGFELAFWLPQIFLLPLTLWVAVLVTRYVDQPAVKATAWLYQWTLGGGATVAAEPPREDTVNVLRLA